MTTDLELEDRLISLFEEAGANLRSRLTTIAELDRREAFKTDGARSMTDWLQYRFGYTPETARNYVEAARALEHLPRIADALAAGLLSFDQVRLLAKFATPERDTELARESPGWSSAVLEAHARRAHRPSPGAAAEQHARRFVRVRWDRTRDELRVWGRLPGADGRLLEKTLERLAADAPRNPLDPDRYVPFEKRYADALVELASMRTAADDPDRASLVVHVDEAALRSIQGIGEIEGGAIVPAEVVRRLACDARVQLVVVRGDGEPLGVGRMTRTVPPWLARQLRQRDATCRFPGCRRRRGLQAHHARHWAHGGPTNEDNLVLLCAFHHRLVHECGWRVRVTASGRLGFVRPDGWPLRGPPAPLRLRAATRAAGPPACLRAPARC